MKRILFSIVCISLVTTFFAGGNVSDKNAKLIQAVIDGRLTTVQTLLDGGANPDTKDKDNYNLPVLIWSAYKGHADLNFFG